ncbi:hypothetical protein KJ836_01390 [Patescibacteria group bacterium]|nr:hypothetical protein [Patescibacteria group bacterium]
MNESDDSVVNLNSARNSKYYKDLKEIVESGRCPFCPGGQAFLGSKKHIIYKNRFWMVKCSDYPSENTKYHFIIIPIRHVEKLDELNKDEVVSLHFDILEWFMRIYRISSYILTARSGDPKVTGGSVRHFHYQFLVPEDDKAVTMRFGPPPEGQDFSKEISD